MSADAFLEAGERAPDSLSMAAFQVGAIDSLARAGFIDEAQLLANKIKRKLTRLGNPGLAARAMLNLGNALVYQDRMSMARKVLQSALPQLASSGFVVEAVSARLALSSTHLFGGNPRVAEELALQIIADAVALDAEYLADLARLNLALVYNITGRSDQAYELLTDLLPNLESSSVDVARVQEYLADALFNLNLWKESEETYRQILVDHPRLTPLHAANVELGISRVLMAQGSFVEAEPYLARAIRGYSRLKNRPWHAECLRLRAVIAIDRGNVKKARTMLRRAIGLAEGSPFHYCHILLSLTDLGEDHRLRSLQIIRRNGYLDLEWRVLYQFAQNSERPLMYFRRMFRLILMSRLGINSVTARFGFLKDKDEALRAYLDELLTLPTKSHIHEAMSVIEQMRSVTLIDEILAQPAISDDLRETFQKLRTEIGPLLDEAPNGHARLQKSACHLLSRAQKSVTSGLMRLKASGLFSNDSEVKSVVISETKSGISILSRGGASRPMICDREIAKILRWLPFELLAPMATKDSNATDALRLLHQLSDAFSSVWSNSSLLICPDGITWRVPWTLCGSLAGCEEEWSIAMHPRMTGSFDQRLTKNSRAMVWLGRAQNLPYSEKEAEAVAAKFPDCQILTTAKEAKESLSGSFDVVHVVAHAIHRPQNPLLSSIEFPDGPLFASEIARSPLQVGLATLSACETGSISLVTRNEPDGIARAFIARGAQSTVASLWPLDDESAYIQFTALYNSVLEGKNISSALFSSRCICREWQPHPYFWGALALYTGYPQ